MPDQQPGRGPVDGFFRACILILFSAIALSLAFDLLSRIWIWLLLAVIVTTLCVIAYFHYRRQRW